MLYAMRHTWLSLLVAAALAACQRSAPPPPAAMMPTPAATAAAREDAAAAEVGVLRAEVRSLRAQINALQLAAADAKGEAERYQAGLQRCVDELNSQSQAHAARPAYVPSAPEPRRPAARLSTLGAPDVQIVGDNVFVTGRVWNSGDGDASGRLYVELLRDGQVVDSATLALDVPARTDQAYSTTFRPLISNGTYSARVRFDL